MNIDLSEDQVGIVWGFLEKHNVEFQGYIQSVRDVSEEDAEEKAEEIMVSLDAE